MLRIILTASLACLFAQPAIARDAHHHDPHGGPVMHYRTIDARLATGGHLTGDGAARLAAAGYELVIDLREDPPADENRALKRAGIEKIHVPVSWQNPQPGDFAKFADALDAHRDRKVLVQCAANFRASAMTYLYRRLRENVPEADARRDLDAVWEPNPVWRGYIRATVDGRN